VPTRQSAEDRALALRVGHALSRHHRLLLCPGVNACCPPPALSAIKPAHGFVGWYSNRARGEQAKAHKTLAAPVPVLDLYAPTIEPAKEPVSAFAARARSAWARLIRKVYEADPLECPKCKGPMRIIALIDDPLVVRRILEHLRLWQPEAMERSPPVPPEAWPVNSVLPMTNHPVPDIA